MAVLCDRLRIVPASGGYGLSAEAQLLSSRLDSQHTKRGQEANLATVLLLKHRYEEAVKDLSAALRVLETQADNDVGKLIVVYVARSRTLCDMKQCEEGLRDLARALALANGRFAVNSLGMISIAAVRGFEQIRAGSVEQGGEAFRQAIRLVDSRTDLSPSVRTEIRLRILESYSQSLTRLIVQYPKHTRWRVPTNSCPYLRRSGGWEKLLKTGG